ncbi:MAG: hypothetical protein HRT35_23260, partial [Algicola sp.]|nr:hypothetical protein [Algicola sp.]
MLTDKHNRKAINPILPSDGQSKARNGSLGENQKGLWRLIQMQPDTTAYNIQVMFRVGPECQLPVLEQAFALMLKQYPLLCAAIIEKDGEPHYDYPYQARDFAMQHCDLSQLSAKQQKTWLSNRMDLGFCLQSTPLTRPLFLKCG